MQTDDTERYWANELANVRSSVADLAGRLKTPQPINAGSSLFTDDDGFPTLRVGTTVGYKIAVSAEHLHLACESAAAVGASPTAHLTLLRTALMAAAHATRLLEGNRMERRVQALHLRADDLRGQLTLVRAARVLPDEESQAANSELEIYLGQQLDDLQATAVSLGVSVDTRRIYFNHTAAVVAAAKAAYLRNTEMIGVVEHIWRLGSSAAHGERSFATRRGVATGMGASYGQLKASMIDIGMAAVASWAILDRAVRSFDLRR